jgi:rSAM/selenodomain-associated transferase 1
MSGVTLIVLAKAPRAGQVKTRLCPPCSAAEAALLAEAALGDTLATVAATDVAKRVVVLDGPPGAWLPAGFMVIPQRGGGLDERLAAAFCDVGGPALLVGMDTPQVTPDLLAVAAEPLAGDGPDAVIGLAEDGGYWSIGLRRADPRVFCGVPMSTASTARSQLARLRALNLRVGFLATLRDVDRYADARAVAALAPDTRFAAALATIGPEAAVA